MVRHHPDEQLLVDFATGAQARAPALAIAGHLAYCPACRAAVAEVEALGGELLRHLEPAPMDDEALDAYLARLDEPFEAAAEPGTVTNDNSLPATLTPFCPSGLSALSWQSVGGFFDEAPLALESSGFRISVIRVAPGQAVPEHGHAGNEYMLVLAGGFRSGHRHFRVGDFSACAGSEHHTPLADEGAACICLMVLDAPLVFREPIDAHVGPEVRS